VRLRVAAIQMNTQDNKESNVARAETLIDEAAAGGARFVAMPEYCNYLGEDKPGNAESIPGPTTERFRRKAIQHGIYLHCGSVIETGPNGKVYNTTVVYDPKGNELGRYRKIHLYDVSHLGGQYCESTVVEPGDGVVTVDVDDWRVGLSICYDIRFPELYRALAERGAQILMIPAAFTLYTGKDHWEVLQRARAIENAAFVICPAQFGSHPPAKQSFGNTMVIDPWGTVIARAQEGDTVVLADLDMEYRSEVLKKVPALDHRHPLFGGPVGRAGVHG